MDRSVLRLPRTLTEPVSESTAKKVGAGGTPTTLYTMVPCTHTRNDVDEHDVVD